MPKDVTARRKDPCGTVCAARSGDMLALSWVDKRKVLMLSTKHSVAVVLSPLQLNQPIEMYTQNFSIIVLYVHVHACVSVHV